jgi:hypothetical protein
MLVGGRGVVKGRLSSGASAFRPLHGASALRAAGDSIPECPLATVATRACPSPSLYDEHISLISDD